MSDTPNAAESDPDNPESVGNSDGHPAVETTDEAEGSDRDVVVPLPLYKVVTVFSTLISGGAVVFGFVVLDEATQRASAPADEIDPLLALLGLLLIAGGGALYAFSGRFRAPGMGTTKSDDPET
jgi:hypothetical protein